MLLTFLRELWPWTAIKNCPGRFVVSKHGDDVPPERVLEMLREKYPPAISSSQMIRARRFDRGPAKDDVFVAVFLDSEGGGLITFCKKASSGSGYVHTLNEPSGLERKLKGLDLYEEMQALDKRD